MVRRCYFQNNSLTRPKDISIDQFCYAQSGLRYFDLLQPCTLYLSKGTVTPKNIEGPLIMTQQNLTQFFDTTSNKRKPDGPDDNRKTTVTPKKKKIRGQTLKNILTIFDNTLLRRWSYVFNIFQTLNLPGCTMKFSPGLGQYLNLSDQQQIILKQPGASQV